MSKAKTFAATFIILAIFMTCAVVTSASLSSTLNVYWNARETEAWATNDCSGPLGRDFYANVYIVSMSTGDSANDNKNSFGIVSMITATTDHVAVTYPSPIPLVNYGGSHGFMD